MKRVLKIIEKDILKNIENQDCSGEIYFKVCYRNE